MGGDPVVDLAETGAAAVAWRELRGAAGVVAVQERRADGVNEQASLSAARGGGVGRLVIGGSGLGDAMLAWQQGEGPNSQIAAAVVNAPPDPFLVLLPSGWQRKRRIPIAWDRTLNAIGGVRYSVSVDDEPVIENLRRLHAQLSPDHVGDGKHRIQIFAVDQAGQETGSRTGRLLVDRRAPRVRLRRRRERLTVIVTDAGSGMRSGFVRVTFGDGARAVASLRRSKKRGGGISKAVAQHAFDRAGRYPVLIRARDRAGNRSKVRKQVRVR